MYVKMIHPDDDDDATEKLYVILYCIFFPLSVFFFNGSVSIIWYWRFRPFVNVLNTHEPLEIKVSRDLLF